MTKYRIIPPTHDKDEFYEYLYKVWTMSQKKEVIPTHFYRELIEYYKEVENYERCEELAKIIKNRKNE